MYQKYLVTFILLLPVFSSGLYFHIGETERKCFIEEIPDETMVTGESKIHNSHNVPCLTVILSLKKETTKSSFMTQEPMASRPQVLKLECMSRSGILMTKLFYPR